MAIVIIIAVSLLVGFGSGWGVKGWKDGAHIAKIESRDSVLTAANDRCDIDIDDVRKGVESISVAVGHREKAAAEAMSKAQVLAAKHSQTAITIKAAPVVPEETQCDAIVREQIEYVQSRDS
jgi:hypothetical protein